MSTIIIILLSLIIGAVVAIALVPLFRRQNFAQVEPQNDALLLIQNQLRDFMDRVDAKVGSSNKEMQESVHLQFNESQKLIKEINELISKNLANVTREVTSANETSKQVLGITDQLKNLEKVLTHQKQRGNLGEAALDMVLSHILPPNLYKQQYQFKNGEVVDAVIMTKDGMIPVDAKFSLDNYNRVINESDQTRKEELVKDFRNDLKKRIDETSKYVREAEGTLPFAIMFIPAEGIYYDLLVNEIGGLKGNERSLIDYATNEKKVTIVSPTTFSVYLQTILFGFRSFKIEKDAQLIRGRVSELHKHLTAYDTYFKKLGSTLSTSVNHYNAASKELTKVDKDMVKITGETAEIDPLLIEKPFIEE